MRIYLLLFLLPITQYSFAQHLHVGLATGTSYWADNKNKLAWDKGIIVGYETKKFFAIEASFNHTLRYQGRYSDYLGNNSQMKYRDDLFEYSVAPMVQFIGGKRKFSHYLGLKFAYGTEIYKEEFEYQAGGFTKTDRLSYFCYGLMHCIKYTIKNRVDVSLKTSVQLVSDGQFRLQPMLTAAYRIF